MHGDEKGKERLLPPPCLHGLLSGGAKDGGLDPVFTCQGETSDL
jgi:hypothetical protein